MELQAHTVHIHAHARAHTQRDTHRGESASRTCARVLYTRLYTFCAIMRASTMQIDPWSRRWGPFRWQERVCVFACVYWYSVSVSRALYRMEFRIQTSEGLNNLCSNFRADDFDSLPFVLTNIEAEESVKKKEDRIVYSREIVSEPQLARPKPFVSWLQTETIRRLRAWRLLIKAPVRGEGGNARGRKGGGSGYVHESFTVLGYP